MYTFLIHHHVSPLKQIIRYVPPSIQAFQRQFIYHEPRGDYVGDRYLRGVGAPENLRPQISGLFTNLVEVGAIVKQCPAIGLARRETEHRNPGLSSNRDHRIDGNADRDIAADP
jgi:hypothetical protein